MRPTNAHEELTLSPLKLPRKLRNSDWEWKSQVFGRTIGRNGSLLPRKLSISLRSTKKSMSFFPVCSTVPPEKFENLSQWLLGEKLGSGCHFSFFACSLLLENAWGSAEVVFSQKNLLQKNYVEKVPYFLVHIDENDAYDKCL